MLPKEQWGVIIGVGVGIAVHAFVGTLVIVAHAPSSRRCWCVGSGLFGSRMTLLMFAISLTVLLLHQDQLRGRQRCGLPVAGLGILPEHPVKVGNSSSSWRLASVSSSRRALHWASMAR
jgi:hypothetical protein